MGGLGDLLGGILGGTTRGGSTGGVGAPDGELPDEDELDRKFGRLHELDGVDKG